MSRVNPVKIYSIRLSICYYNILKGKYFFKMNRAIQKADIFKIIYLIEIKVIFNHT